MKVVCNIETTSLFGALLYCCFTLETKLGFVIRNTSPCLNLSAMFFQDMSAHAFFHGSRLKHIASDPGWTQADNDSCKRFSSSSGRCTRVPGRLERRSALPIDRMLHFAKSSAPMGSSWALRPRLARPWWLRTSADGAFRFPQRSQEADAKSLRTVMMILILMMMMMIKQSKDKAKRSNQSNGKAKQMQDKRSNTNHSKAKQIREKKIKANRSK